jgi:hypothetical protein
MRPVPPVRADLAGRRWAGHLPSWRADLRWYTHDCGNGQRATLPADPLRALFAGKTVQLAG